MNRGGFPPGHGWGKERAMQAFLPRGGPAAGHVGPAAGHVGAAAGHVGAAAGQLGAAVLRRLDPETAHRLALRLAGAAATLARAPAHDPRLARTVLGLRFPTPIGLAAGFDKDAAAPAAWGRLGFGFAELGTVTPRPQPGNPRPRLFRLVDDDAVINRMGFNNGGIERCLRRVAAARASGRVQVPLGINVGINKEGADPLRDYPALVEAASALADYVTINVSSPNTPGLRALQDEERLAAILRAVRARVPAATPLLVKLAPDLADAALASLVRMVADEGAQGVIATNTTLARPATLRSAAAAEAGGLSGTPLAARARAVLAILADAREALSGGRAALAIVSCGGIGDGADIAARLDAGADLVQLYTAWAYAGPTLLARLERELLAATTNRT